VVVVWELKFEESWGPEPAKSRLELGIGQRLEKEAGSSS
jgi:hypothetical protein